MHHSGQPDGGQCQQEVGDQHRGAGIILPDPLTEEQRAERDAREHRPVEGDRWIVPEHDEQTPDPAQQSGQRLQDRQHHQHQRYSPCERRSGEVAGMIFQVPAVIHDLVDPGLQKQNRQEERYERLQEPVGKCVGWVHVGREYPRGGYSQLAGVD